MKLLVILLILRSDITLEALIYFAIIHFNLIPKAPKYSLN